MTAIRTLLVDDNATILASVEHFVNTLPGMEVVGRAMSAQQAFLLIGQLHPDLVLMDVGMPGMNGLEATRLIKRLSTAPRVIILSVHDQREYRDAATSVRADGYVAKGDIFPQLPVAVRHLFQASSQAALAA